MVFSKGYDEPNDQTGQGTLDTWVQKAEEDNNIIPNSQTTRIHLPPNFHIISDSSYLVQRHRLTTRRLEVRSHDDVQGFIEDLLNLLLQQVDPEDKVAMSISSEEFPKEICHISFRRAKFLNYKGTLKAIKAMIQSGSLNEHFLDMPVRVVFHRCEGIRGQKRKLIEDSSIYTKRTHHIVRTRNGDKINLARVLVVAIARKKKEEEPTNQDLARQYKTLAHSRKQAQRIAALELMAQAGVTEEDCYSSVEKFQETVSYQINALECTERGHTFIYKGPVDLPKIYLLKTGGHYDVITKMEPLFGTFYSCPDCFKGFNYKAIHHGNLTKQ